jgi:hypothetical protein
MQYTSMQCSLVLTSTMQCSVQINAEQLNAVHIKVPLVKWYNTTLPGWRPGRHIRIYGLLCTFVPGRFTIRL